MEENREPTNRMPYLQWLAFYLASLLVGLTLTFLMDSRWGVDPVRTLSAYIAIVFSLAVIGTPPLIYRVIRNTGWFALIDDDRIVRVVLGFLALVGASVALSQ